MRDSDAERLMAVLADTLQTDVSLSPFLTIRTGGPAALFLEARNERDICRAIQEARRLDIPYLVLGNGSNMLVSDQGFDGLVIHLGREFAQITLEGEYMDAQAGALLPAVAKRAAAASLSGLEFASGIPGSVGGAAFMNAGAFGGDMSSVIVHVRCLTPQGEVVQLDVADLAYGYRTSRIMQEGLIVLSVRLKLSPGNQEDILARMDAYTAERRQKQPINYPSAGSFFRRPEGHFAGALIEQCGLKDRNVGGAAVSTLHAGFLINTGGATTQDFLTLMQIIQAEVFQRFGVQLENEVRIVNGTQP